MMPNWINLPPVLAIYGPGLAAFALALGGMALARRAEPRWPLVAALAALAGWMLLLPAPRAWVMPRVVAEHLVVPALAAVLGAAAAPFLSGRPRGWAATAALGFAGWWLAGAAVARGEFWRVWFSVTLVTWALRLLGGRAAPGGAMVGLVLLLGTAASGVAPAWSGVAAVLLGASLGVAALRPGAVLGSVIPAIGVVGMDLGTGGLVRGRLEMMDLVCAGSVLAPKPYHWLVRSMGGRVERLVGRRFGRAAAGVLAGMATAVLVVGAAWIAARLIRR